jgi:hypothetical protein
MADLRKGECCVGAPIEVLGSNKNARQCIRGGRFRIPQPLGRMLNCPQGALSRR